LIVESIMQWIHVSQWRKLKNAYWCTETPYEATIDCIIVIIVLTFVVIDIGGPYNICKNVK